MFNNREEVIREEITRLETEGVIDAKVAKKILAEYEEDSTGHIDRFVPFLTGSGAVLVGLGFILYFAANWGNISDLSKTILLLASVASTGIAGYILSEMRDMKKTGAALMIMSSFFYGASIFLLGQIYNLGGSLTGAFALWAVGVLPMAYYTRLRLLLLMAWGLMVATLFSYLEEHHIQYAWYVMMVVVGTVIMSFSLLHKRLYPDFSKDLVRVGSLLTLGASYFLTFDLVHTGYWTGYTGALPLLLAPSAIAIGFVWVLTARKWFNLIESSVIAGHVAVITAIASTRYAEKLSSPLLWGWSTLDFISIGYSVYFFLMLLFVAYAGVKRNSKELVNISVAFIGLFILTKFFDAFSNMMDRAMFFIVGGILLVGIGYGMEQLRKRLLARISH